MKNIRKNRKCKTKDEIKEKLELPGITVTGLHQYFSEDKDIGTYPNIKKHNLKPNKNKAHLRIETDDVSMIVEVMIL